MPNPASIILTALLTLLVALPFVQAEDDLPRLLDLGAHKCVPCKKMAPILQRMKEDFAGVLEVQFIDVWKNPEAGKKHGIRRIPTQIFFDADGKELFRHIGFIGRKEMLARWRQLGYDFKPVTPETGSDDNKAARQKPRPGSSAP